MNRRTALSTLSIAAGGSALVPSFLLTACQSEQYIPVFFTSKEIQLLNEIAETILPTTPDSSGAKDSLVANFMDVYIANCYAPEQQQIFKSGITNFKEQCQKQLGKSFLRLSAPERHDYLVELDKTAAVADEPTFFGQLKSLVLFSYFTSKEGATQALRYIPIPGKYVGNYPFQQGDKAWAL